MAHNRLSRVNKQPKQLRKKLSHIAASFGTYTVYSQIGLYTATGLYNVDDTILPQAKQAFTE